MPMPKVLTPKEQLRRFALLCVSGAPPEVLRHELQEVNAQYSELDWEQGITNLMTWPTIAWSLIVRLHHRELELKKVKAELRVLKRAEKQKQGGAA